MSKVTAVALRFAKRYPKAAKEIKEEFAMEEFSVRVTDLTGALVEEIVKRLANIIAGTGTPDE